MLIYAIYTKRGNLFIFNSAFHALFIIFYNIKYNIMKKHDIQYMKKEEMS